MPGKHAAPTFFRQKETGTSVPNKAAVTYPPPSKTSWDKRAWFLGLFLGNFAGLLLLCACHPVSRRFLKAAFPYSAFGYDTDDLFIIVGVGLGMIFAPGILSGTAKRFYVFWGLLPLPIFSVWFLAAAVVASAPMNLDGSTVLLTAVICWGVSSWPVSLVRYYRQRHRKSMMPTDCSAFKPPRIRFAAISVTAAVTAITLLGWYNLKHPASLEVSVRTSWRLGKESHVPLVVNDRKIYINAWFGGKKEVCRLDTGMDTVEWSKRLHLWGSPTREYGQSCDPTGGCVDTQAVVLPHVCVGNYEVAGLPTSAIGIDLNPLSALQPTGANPEVTLGNAAFVQTVMTVDYRNQELTLRPPEYDFTQQHRKLGDRVLQMHWTTDDGNNSQENRLYGWPAVRVSVAGASFWCALDTGWDGPELGLTADFVKRHPAVGRAKHDQFQFDAMHGSAQVERLHGLDVTIPCSWPPHAAPIPLRMDGLVTPTLYGGDGVIGLALMERYRVTIDYQRRRVLLEPYALAAPGRKQEKASPEAKQPTI